MAPSETSVRPRAASGNFRFPGADTRTIVIGMTGTGKTTFGMWLLSHARFDKRPWIIIDYKGETLLDQIGYPPLQRLKLGKLPKRRGLYVVSPRSDQDDEVEDWLWKLWEHENIGIFADEATLLPNQNAMKAILRQGRSKRIPVIACTQRPVELNREFFTEANFVSLFRLRDERDFKTVQGFTGIRINPSTLPKRWSIWDDAEQGLTLTLKPCPGPDTITARLRERVPFSHFFGG